MALGSWLVVVVVAAAIGVIPYWLEAKSYMFTPQEIEALALPYANSSLPIEEV